MCFDLAVTLRKVFQVTFSKSNPISECLLDLIKKQEIFFTLIAKKLQLKLIVSERNSK